MKKLGDVLAIIGSDRSHCLLQVLHELAAAVPGAQHGHQHLPGHWRNSTQHSGGQCLWFHDAHDHSHAGRLCLAPRPDPWLVDLGLLDWYTSCDVCPYVCVFWTMCASPCNARGQSLLGSFCFNCRSVQAWSSDLCICIPHVTCRHAADCHVTS